MIKSIAHLADIHLMNKLSNQDEQRHVVENLIKKLSEVAPSRILIVGDLFHDFISISNETKVLASYLLNKISEIAPVYITSGNHDRLKRNDKRLDSIKALLSVMNNVNIKYLDETNFFEDENVVYAVWHHPDKMSPWVKHPDYIRDVGKTYIDLFHDPVQGCKSESGIVLNDTHYVNMNSFKGDIVMAGDIHLHNITYVNGKPFFAYPSSLYETKYNEGNGSFHGFILWEGFNDNNVTATPIRVDNDYTHHEVYIGENYNYENIDIQIAPSKFNRVKIKWCDYESAINKTNEASIRKYIKNKYGDSIIELKWDKKPINKNEKIKVNDDVLHNITSLDVQNTAIREYIINVLKYDDVSIADDVIAINNLIQDRMSKDDDMNYNISLLKMKVNNFRGYGDDIEIDIDSLGGLTQIFGNNRTGKTTLMYAFLYVVFGIIPSSKKKEKNSDLRFINNKRDLDYCSVSAIFRINDTNVLIERKTERKWNRGKTEVTSCPTTLEFHSLDDSFNKLINETDEQKKHTQKLIEQAFGTYDDYIRKYYLDSDNLNNILSTDRAVFIDNILFDSGLGIFDKKLDEFKSYRSELSKTRNKIVLDVVKSEEEIINYRNEIEDKKKLITDIEKKIDEYKERSSNLLSEKESKIFLLKEVSDELLNFNITSKESELLRIKENIDSLKKKQDSLLAEANQISVVYSDIEHGKIKTGIDSIKDRQIDVQKNISTISESINSNKSLQNDLNRKISNIDLDIKKFESDIDLYIDKIKANISNGESKVSLYISNIDDKIRDKYKDIEDIKSQKNCLTCGKPIDDAETILNIENRVKQIENEISVLLDSKTNSEYMQKANKALANLRNELVSSVTVNNHRSTIVDLKENKNKLYSELENVKLAVLKLESDLSNERVNYDKLKNELNILIDKEKEFIKVKELIEQKDRLINESNSIPDKITIHELNLQIIEKSILDYKDSLETIEKNKKINQDIATISSNIKEIERLIEVENNSVNVFKMDINSIESKINDLLLKIEAYKKQERLETIENIYLKCVSRDGIPTQLLLKMLPSINDEISKLLTDTPFKVWFDDNIVLQMMSLVSNSRQSVLDGSGMERTFIAFCLKVALSKINNRHVYDIMFIDEITSKLDSEFVDVFKELLSLTKDIVGKILIVDHYNTYEYDNSISVVNDENEISHLEVNV